MQFAAPILDQTDSMNTGSQQLQYIQDTIQSHQMYELQKQQQQLPINLGNIAFEGVTNFNSNDTNILQKKLLELQAELGGLDKEYDQLVEENKQMQDQNDRIKNQNKKIFEKITSHQEHLQLRAGQSQMSAATAIRQNSDATPSVQDNLGLP